MHSTVIEDHEGTEHAQHHHPDLEGIALTLALFQDLLVEEIEVECHGRALVPQVFERRAAGDVEGDKFVGQCLTFRGGQRHLTSFEGIPDFAGQAQLVAQSLQIVSVRARPPETKIR